MRSSDNKHQHDCRFLDSFLHQNFESSWPHHSFKQAEKKLQAKHQHQCDCGLRDGCFHKNFEIHVSNSLSRNNQCSNKGKLQLFWWRHYAISISLNVGSYGIASIKTLNFMSAKVYKIEAINIQRKRNIPILKASICNQYPFDYRLIDHMVGSAKT